MKLIPNGSKADIAQAKIQEAGLNGPELFINLWNNGLINTKNDVIRDIALSLSDGYKNIELKNRTLVVSTGSEVALSDILEKLHSWEPALRIIREAKNNSTSGETLALSVGSKDLFKTVEVMDEETGEISENKEKISSEPVLGKGDDNEEKISYILSNMGVRYENSGNGDFYFSPEDVKNVDTSFVSDIGELLG